MALNVQQLENNLKDVIKKSSKSAMSKTFEIKSSEGLSSSEIKSKVSEDFAKEFSITLAPELAKIIDEYIKSITLTHQLIAPNGKVEGIITVS